MLYMTKNDVRAVQTALSTLDWTAGDCCPFELPSPGPSFLEKNAETCYSLVDFHTLRHLDACKVRPMGPHDALWRHDRATVAIAKACAASRDTLEVLQALAEQMCVCHVGPHATGTASHILSALSSCYSAFFAAML